MQTNLKNNLVIGMIIGLKSFLFPGTPKSQSIINQEHSNRTSKIKSIFTIVALSLIVSSCHQSSERETIRRIVNMTEYSLEIKILSEDTLFYIIDPGASLHIKGFCVRQPTSYCNVGWSQTAAYGEIIFDGNYRQIFESLPSPDCSDKSIIQSPTDNCYGYYMEKEEDIYVFTYIVNSEDYGNAELIE